MAQPIFWSDYQQGAHPAILARLAAENLTPAAGYGTDPVCESARARIRAACDCGEAEVFFLTGGTQTNAVVIDSLLAPYQGVVSARSGHISVHEAGAIEYGGHKVLTLPETQGKLSAGALEALCRGYRADENREHMVMPGAVYLSQPTELGALYTRSELAAIRRVCDDYRLRLYVDGARLAYALSCPENDVTLPELARLCDVFYIGGTKCGALLGEAVVLPKPGILPHFFTMMKQHGALLAKGRTLGIQFDELFREDLYLRIGDPAIRAAARIRSCLRENGFRLAYDTPTNQIFVTLSPEQVERLRPLVGFGFWERLSAEETVVRFVTSWSTTTEEVEEVCSILGALAHKE